MGIGRVDIDVLPVCSEIAITNGGYQASDGRGIAYAG